MEAKAKKIEKAVGGGQTAAWQDDRKHLLHPFAVLPEFSDTGSRIFESGDGVFVQTEEGKRYIDGIGGLWCVNIGYNRPEMAEVIAEQVTKLPYYNTFTDMSSAPAAHLAAKLASLAPDSINHAFFTCSGSASNDTAVRLAHYYFDCLGMPKKQKVIARVNGYHGSTFLAASLTGIVANHSGFNVLSGSPDSLVHFISEPNNYRRPDAQSEEDFCNDLIRELEAKIEELGADSVACFIAEPIMGAGGVIVAPRGYHARAKAVCSKHHILYISDEVVTAFGRLGEFFASEAVFDVVPDIITTAKGISSGYIPLGATLFSDQIFETISQPRVAGQPFSHGFTYSGHPVACAAALKNIEIIENEGILEHVREVGPKFHENLKSLLNLDCVGDVRGSHFMLGIEFVRDKASKEGFPQGVAVGKRVANYAYDAGLIARNVGDYIILSPPLIMTEAQTETVVDVLRSAIKNTQRDLTNEGLR